MAQDQSRRILKFNLGSNKALATGIVMGVLAAAAQAFFRVQPPVADGISFLGHPAYLLKWLLDNIIGSKSSLSFFGSGWAVAREFVVYPCLTVLGVLIGSFVASNRNKEFRLRPGPVRKNFLAFSFGFLVVNFGLLWGACPIRTALLVSYGSVLGVIALASIVGGVLIACVYISWSSKRGYKH
jgi:hypothetical protein